MSCSIQNNSGQDMSALTGMVSKFYPYAQKYLGFDKPAQIVYESDPTNAQDPLGKTAHYQPQNYTVTLYVDGRHPKDLLRSLAHELVHHTQNCRGDLSPEKMGETSDGYAQTDGHLRKMEQEAYASMVMRDWEDQHKSKRRNNLHETIYNNKEYTTMSEHEKLVKAIVAEIMKNAEVTTESEEDEDVQEEGQGDRNDSDREQGRASSDHRQGTSSGGGAGQNLEEDGKAGKMDRKDIANKATGRWLKEGEDEDEEPVEEMQAAGYAGAKQDKHRSPKTGKKCYDDRGNQVECGSKDAVKESKDEDEESVEEGWERPKSATGAGPSAKAGKQDRKDVANQVPSGFVNEDEESDGETIEESDEDETIEESDDETTDDLKETFVKRQEALYERLIKRWAK